MSQNNQARVKQSGKFASDEDASNLLADILNDTAMDAEAEQRRIEQELRAKEADEKRAREAEERKREEEAQARLNAEQSRQNQVQQRRTEKLQALKIEELKEKGEWVDPAIEEAKRRAEEERQRQAQLQAAIQQQVAQQQAAQQLAQQQAAALHAPTPEAKRGKGPVLALVAVLALVLVAGGVIAALTLGAYKPDTTSYPKLTLAPKENKDSLTTAQFAPLPAAAVAVASPTSKTTKSTPRADRDTAKPDKKPTKPTKKPTIFDIDGDDDIFGGVKDK